ncbi:peptidoglycan-binding protein LysM [Scytonema hofmannii PCC 7110]|uniref:Peptidoglycan-binding protein LysM n=1 Tax=Scytonema hofmannii PCC 7110 TaxID=128403 RepID=A0A139XG16_9CYAN|nr:LysM peptidoglycan-binding domain-containing protein [Scytonema hofmannii]KYC43637.1 peptidoglycan-binding protein LysM [Scytonema hofmannii PCC 7110]
MTLAKLKIRPKSPSRLPSIEVLFNPTTYAITKSVNWTLPQDANGKSIKSQNYLNAPTLSFSGGGSRQLSLDLFFDVTESRFQDVREETNKIVALTRIEPIKPTPRPPTCEVSWGNARPNSDFPFVGVVSSLTQKFTLFRRDGKPVRAELNVVFLELLDAEADRRQTDPEMTTRVVRLGDTLSSIAAEVYQDPTNWRMIAEANGLDNPLDLKIGTSLSIPSLR